MVPPFYRVVDLGRMVVPVVALVDIEVVVKGGAIRRIPHGIAPKPCGERIDAIGSIRPMVGSERRLRAAGRDGSERTERNKQSIERPI